MTIKNSITKERKTQLVKYLHKVDGIDMLGFFLNVKCSKIIYRVHPTKIITHKVWQIQLSKPVFR